MEHGGWSISPRVGVRRENFYPNLLRFMMFSIPYLGCFCSFFYRGSGQWIWRETHHVAHLHFRIVEVPRMRAHSSCTPTYLPLLIKKSTTILYRDEARSLDPLTLSLTHTDSLSQS